MPTFVTSLTLVVYTMHGIVLYNGVVSWSNQKQKYIEHWFELYACCPVNVAVIYFSIVEINKSNRQTSPTFVYFQFTNYNEGRVSRPIFTSNPTMPHPNF
jgi:hypothetical protein